MISYNRELLLNIGYHYAPTEPLCNGELVLIYSINELYATPEDRENVPHKRNRLAIDVDICIYYHFSVLLFVMFIFG